MSGANEARAGLAKSMVDNRDQMAITDESRRLLADMLRDEMRIAVAEGVSAAMTDENAARFVRAVIAETQKMATLKAGEMAGSAIKALLGRTLLFVFVGSIVYAWGGWAALAAMGKWVMAAKG